MNNTLTPPPNYIQFTSLYRHLNQAHWKAHLNRSAQTNLSNLRACVNHSIVLHNFQYPFNLLGNDSTQLIGVTHQFKVWNDQKVQHMVVINIHPCFITQYPIIRTSHRGDCPLLMLTWWDIPSRIPSELEDSLLYDSRNTSFQLVLLITCLDEFFLLNQEPIHDLESQLPSYPPPQHASMKKRRIQIQDTHLHSCIIHMLFRVTTLRKQLLGGGRFPVLNELCGKKCIEGSEPIVDLLVVKTREMSFEECSLFGGAPRLVTYKRQELG